MGSSLHKDKNAQLYITLDKRVHYAGQMVTGAVHINCTQDRLCYQHLNLRLRGKENCQWTEHNGQLSITYTNQRQTYIEDLGLAKFPSGLLRGQYTYPFSFLLPASLPSSMKIDGCNYIKYKLSACLPNYQDHSHDQTFDLHLHVRQPPKNLKNNLKGHSISESQCCNCCCSCGKSNLSLEANVTHLQYGKPFRVHGHIDSQNSKTPIKDYRIVLREVITKVSDIGHIEKQTTDYLLYQRGKNILQGGSDNIEAELRIPKQVIGFTAIGNIISRAYFLTLVCEVNCCYSNPTMPIPATFLSYLEPPFEEGEQQDAPPGWNPNVAEMKVITQVPPYFYKPEKGVVPYEHDVPPNMEMQMGQKYHEQTKLA